MVKDIYESICRGEDVRANLICLKQLIADKKEKSAFAYMLAGDFRKLAALLKDKDASTDPRRIGIRRCSSVALRSL